MRVCDIGFVLTNSWGDILTDISPDPYTNEQVEAAQEKIGAVVHQVPIRLMPDNVAGEDIAQAVMNAVFAMDLLDVEPNTKVGIGGEDEEGIVLGWKPNADEQLGRAIKQILGGISMQRKS